jgi:hypothetical protein
MFSVFQVRGEFYFVVQFAERVQAHERVDSSQGPSVFALIVDNTGHSRVASLVPTDCECND